MSSKKQVVVHRFGWRNEEIGCVIGATVLGVGLGVWIGGLAGLLTGLSGPIASVLIWHMGHKRKNDSAVTVTLHADTIKHESKGLLKKGFVAESDVALVALKKVGSRQVLALNGDGKGMALIPADLAAEQPIRDLLDRLIAANVEVTKDAQAQIAHVVDVTVPASSAEPIAPASADVAAMVAALTPAHTAPNYSSLDLAVSPASDPAPATDAGSDTGAAGSSD